VSLADQRRQQSLDAAGHLGQCPTCADLVAPLAERKSRLAGIAAAPFVMLGAGGGRLVAAARKGSVQATAGVTAVAVAVGAVLLTGAGPHPAPVSAPRAAPVRRVQQPPSDLRTAAGADLLALQPSAWKALAGQRVIGDGIAVQSVVSHPGFWIGTSAQRRIYVHLTSPGLVRNPLRVGQKVTFTGVIEPNPPNFALSEGVAEDEGESLLVQQGMHLVVDVRRLTRH
jgi:hypothetical protein